MRALRIWKSRRLYLCIWDSPSLIFFSSRSNNSPFDVEVERESESISSSSNGSLSPLHPNKREWKREKKDKKHCTALDSRTAERTQYPPKLPLRRQGNIRRRKFDRERENRKHIQNRQCNAHERNQQKSKKTIQPEGNSEEGRSWSRLPWAEFPILIFSILLLLPLKHKPSYSHWFSSLHPHFFPFPSQFNYQCSLFVRRRCWERQETNDRTEKARENIKFSGVEASACLWLKWRVRGIHVRSQGGREEREAHLAGGYLIN